MQNSNNNSNNNNNSNKNIAYSNIDFSTRFNTFNQLKYIIKQSIMDINTIKVCKVVAVNENGTLDIQNMVYHLDANMQPIEPAVLKNIHILQIQGGTSGFQVKYKVNDIVLVGFCDRDTQAVARSKVQSAPSTLLPFPLSSGVVLGAVFFADQNIYVKVDDKIYNVGNVNISENLNVEGSATINGDTETKGNNEAKTYSVGGTAGASLSFTDLEGNTHIVKNGIIIS